VAGEAVRIWLEVSHHAAFRVGGWAFVRADGAEVTGLAGGERRVDAERTALLGLLAALTGIPAGRAVRVQTTSLLVAGLPARITSAQAGEDAPTENLDLWAQAMAALKAVEIVRVAAAPGTPVAFAAAWAELARDKAKDKGPFSSAIPKTNLAKAGVR
jgi:hypothetical protein